MQSERESPASSAEILTPHIGEPIEPELDVSGHPWWRDVAELHQRGASDVADADLGPDEAQPTPVGLRCCRRHRPLGRGALSLTCPRVFLEVRLGFGRPVTATPTAAPARRGSGSTAKAHPGIGVPQLRPRGNG